MICSMRLSRLGDLALALAVAGLGGVGGVGDDRQHPRVAQLGETMEVGRVLVHRRQVELEVAGVHQRAVGRVDGDGGGVGDAVGDAQEFHFHLADADLLAELDGVQLHFGREMILLQALFHHGHGEPGAVARRVMEGREQVLRRADVVEVPVREEHRFDLALSPAQTRDIGDEVVDAEHVLVRELQSQVDDVDVFLHLDDEAVASHLLEAAERVDAQLLGFLIGFDDGGGADGRHAARRAAVESLEKRTASAALASLAAVGWRAGGRSARNLIGHFLVREKSKREPLYTRQQLKAMIPCDMYV
jgi:hypothetical protein